MYSGNVLNMASISSSFSLFHLASHFTLSVFLPYKSQKLSKELFSFISFPFISFPFFSFLFFSFIALPSLCGGIAFALSHLLNADCEAFKDFSFLSSNRLCTELDEIMSPLMTNKSNSKMTAFTMLSSHLKSYAMPSQSIRNAFALLYKSSTIAQ